MSVHRLNLKGLVAPVFTPMRPDGSLDADAVWALADHVARQRLAGVFCCGTSGEGASLSVQERKMVLDWWCEAAAGRFPVIAQAGAAGITDTLLLAAHAGAAGAAAVAVLPPFYFKPAGVKDLVGYCADVADAAGGLSFYYYHIPSMTHVALPMREFLALASERVPTFAGLKYSDSDLADFGRCVSFAQGRFDLFYGRDEMLLSALAVGATAAVGTTYNLIAPLYERMIRAFAGGDIATARDLQHRSREIVAAMERFGGLPAMKAAMAFVGIDCGPCRRPLATLDAAQRSTLRDELGRLGFFDFVRPEGADDRERPGTLAFTRPGESGGP
jgi:N-acetylneuraminate lyase